MVMANNLQSQLASPTPVLRFDPAQLDLAPFVTTLTQKVNNKLSDVDEFVEKLKNLVPPLNSPPTVLRATNAIWAKAAKELSEVPTAFQGLVAELRNSCQTVVGEYNKAAQSLNDIKRTLEDKLEAKLEELEQKRKELDGQVKIVEQANHAIGISAAQATKAQEDLRLSQREIELQQQVIVKDNTINELKTEVGGLKNEQDAAVQARVDQILKRYNIEARDLLEGNKAAVTAANQRAETAEDEAQAQKTKHTHKKTELKRKIETLENERVNGELGKIRELNNLASALTQANQQFGSTKNEMEASSTAIKTSIEGLVKEFNQIKSNIDQANSEGRTNFASKLNEVNISLTHAVTEARSTVEGLVNIEKHKTEWEAEHKERFDDAVTVGHYLEEGREDTRVLAQELQSMIENHEKMSKMNEEMKNLQGLLQTLGGTYEGLAADRKANMRQRRELQRDLQRMRQIYDQISAAVESGVLRKHVEEVEEDPEGDPFAPPNNQVPGPAEDELDLSDDEEEENAVGGPPTLGPAELKRVQEEAELARLCKHNLSPTAELPQGKSQVTEKTKGGVRHRINQFAQEVGKASRNLTTRSSMPSVRPAGSLGGASRTSIAAGSMIGAPFNPTNLSDMAKRFAAMPGAHAEPVPSIPTRFAQRPPRQFSARQQQSSGASVSGGFGGLSGFPPNVGHDVDAFGNPRQQSLAEVHQAYLRTQELERQRLATITQEEALRLEVERSRLSGPTRGPTKGGAGGLGRGEVLAPLTGARQSAASGSTAQTATGLGPTEGGGEPDDEPDDDTPPAEQDATWQEIAPIFAATELEGNWTTKQMETLKTWMLHIAKSKDKDTLVGLLNRGASGPETTEAKPGLKCLVRLADRAGGITAEINGNRQDCPFHQKGGVGANHPICVSVKYTDPALDYVVRTPEPDGTLKYRKGPTNANKQGQFCVKTEQDRNNKRWGLSLRHDQDDMQV